MVGSLVRAQRTGIVAMFFEQNREVERASGIAALVGPSEVGLGGRLVALLIEQHPQTASGSTMAELVGSLEGRRRSAPIVVLFKQDHPVLVRPIGLFEIVIVDCCLARGAFLGLSL